MLRLGFALTTRQARQLVSHGHVLLDGKRVDVPSARVKPEQTIEISGKARNFVSVREALEITPDPPPYLYRNKEQVQGTLSRQPERDEVPLPVAVEERLIVEYSWVQPDSPAALEPGRAALEPGCTSASFCEDDPAGLPASEGVQPMQLGMVGLGRMGANLSRRLMRAGHEVVVYDVSADAVARLEGEGATASASAEDLVAKLAAAGGLDHGAAAYRRVDRHAARRPDGRGRHRDRRREQLLPRRHRAGGVRAAGGALRRRRHERRVFGLDRGFCMMIGGEDDVVAHLDPIFAALAPGVAAAPRTPGRERRADPARPRPATCTAGRPGPATS